MKDNCVLVKRDRGNKVTLLVAIYVDDGLVCSKDRQLLAKVIKHLETKFEVFVMDPNCFVGLQIVRDRMNRTLTISQPYYIKTVVERFGLQNAKTESTPISNQQQLCKAGVMDGNDHPIVKDKPYRQAIGCLGYAQLGTRPDISYTVGLLGRYSEEPRTSHWRAIKKAICYLKGTANYGITYGKDGENEIRCYVDSDYAGDLDDRKSTTGYIIMFNGGPIVWRSKKQTINADSTTVAEYVPANMACKDVLWTQQLLHELGYTMSKPTPLLIDNQSAIKLILNTQVHAKTKHIDVMFMFVRDQHLKKKITAQYIPTKEQLADIITKAVSRDQFQYIRKEIGIEAVRYKQSEANIAQVLNINNDNITNNPEIVTSTETTMHKQILFTIVALEIMVSTTATQKRDIDTYDLLLDFQNICYQLPYDTDHEGKDELSKIQHVCDKHYKESVKPLLDQLAICIDPTPRSKRTVLTDIIANVIGTGVNNILTKKFDFTDDMKTKQEQVNKEVLNLANHVLLGQTEIRQLIIREIERSSESAIENRKIVLDIVEFFPKLIAIAHYLEINCISVRANLKAIVGACTEGRMATRELGELLGYNNLSHINPMDTTLYSIEVNKEDESARFKFAVRSPKKSVEAEFKMNSSDLPIILSVTILVSILLMGMGMYCGIRIWIRLASKKENNTTTNRDPDFPMSPVYCPYDGVQ